MLTDGEQTVPVSRERLWDLLMDPTFLSAVIPGCGELEQLDAHRYKGVLSARIGPIESQFATDLTISDAEFPDRFRLNVMGQGAGSFVSSDVQIELIDHDDNVTRLLYRGKTSVGGRLAAIGQRLIETAAKNLVKKGFDDLRKRVEVEVENSAWRPISGDDV